MVKPSRYQQVADRDFEKIVLQTKNPAVVVFGTESMGGISMLHLVMEDLAPCYTKLYFLFLDTSTSAFRNKFPGFGKILTIFFQNGNIVYCLSGLTSKSKLRELIEHISP